MKRRRIAILAVCVLLILIALSPVLLRKYRVPLGSSGNVTAIAMRPFILPWNENEFSVYVGGAKAFSLWGDAYDEPLVIYPIEDNKRFLCIDDDDTSVLVFVVDLDPSKANTVNTAPWPPNDYLRNYISDRMTRVIITQPNGVVRLPNLSEVQEVSRNLDSLTNGELNDISFPGADFGVYRFYWSKKALLSELASNRQSAWP